MSINQQLIQLRVFVRKNGSDIVDNVRFNYIKRVDGRANKLRRPNACIVCGANENITKEHLLPQWVFERNGNKTFVTDVNQLRHKYIQSTVSACKRCNNELLGKLESFIIKTLQRIDPIDELPTEEEMEALIHWLELIDYKFHINDITKRFIKAPGKYIEYLADFPLSMIRDGGVSDNFILKELRSAQKRITISNKTEHYNSMVILRTRNPSFHFFHHNNDFIFLELPQYRKAIFYFYKRIFNTFLEAKAEAKTVIEKYYRTLPN